MAPGLSVYRWADQVCGSSVCKRERGRERRESCPTTLYLCTQQTFAGTMDPLKPYILSKWGLTTLTLATGNPLPGASPLRPVTYLSLPFVGRAGLWCPEAAGTLAGIPAFSLMDTSRRKELRSLQGCGVGRAAVTVGSAPRLRAGGQARAGTGWGLPVQLKAALLGRAPAEGQPGGAGSPGLSGWTRSSCRASVLPPLCPPLVMGTSGTCVR